MRNNIIHIAQIPSIDVQLNSLCSLVHACMAPLLNPWLIVFVNKIIEKRVASQPSNVSVHVCFLSWSLLDLRVAHSLYITRSTEPYVLNAVCTCFTLKSMVKTLNCINQMNRRRLWSCIFHNQPPTVCVRCPCGIAG